MPTSNNTLRNAGIGIVLLNALVTAIHATAHSRLSILMSLWQNAFIFVVIVAMPLIAALLLWRGAKLGFHLLAFSMFGSLIFGGYYHFVAHGPDNVASLMDHPWAFPFQVSAVILAVVESAGFLIGLFGVVEPPG